MERLKKLLLSQTIKDTLISFVGLGFAAVVGFIFTVIIARYLGPGQFGVFSAITALVAIICSMGDLGVASALINFLPKLKDKRSELISTSLWFEIIVGILIFILFLVFTIFHRILIPGSLSNQIIIAGILTVNYLFLSFVQGVFTAERRFLHYSLTQIIDSGIKITVIYFLLSTSRLSIGTALLANVISTVFALLFTYGKEFLKTKPLYSKDIFLKLFSFAKWIAVARFFSVFVARIDVILLNLLSSNFQAGIFGAAMRITFLFSLLVSSLGAVINPRFSSFERKEEVIVYIKKLFGLITAISFFMLLTIFLAKPIINIVFGDEYIAAVPIFQALTVSMIPFIYSLITTPALIYTFNKPKFVANVTAIQVSIMVLLEIILIPTLGSFAPPIAIGIANIFVFLVTGRKLMLLLSKKSKD